MVRWKKKIHTQYILSEGIPAEGDSSKGGRIDFWKLTTYENANNRLIRFSWIKRLSFSQLCEKRLTKWWRPIKRCENMVWKNSTQCTTVFGIWQYPCFVTLWMLCLSARIRPFVYSRSFGHSSPNGHNTNWKQTSHSCVKAHLHSEDLIMVVHLY